MMLSEDEWGAVQEKHQGFRPYMDDVLQSDPDKYQQFVQDLHDRGMIDFCNSPKDLITPFFVRKQNNKQRFILDCRGVNRRFQPQPPLAMAAGSAWARVGLRQEDTLYIAQSDIKEYFYSLALPDNLNKSLFCLPPVPHELLQAWGVDYDKRCEAAEGGWVWPGLRVIPMGWSWAMWLSQRVHANICLQETGLSFERVLVDGNPCPDLSGGEVALLPYADILNVLGIDQARVQAVKDKIVGGLRRVGFIVHEELEACSIAQSLGFLIDGSSGVVTPIPERLDRVVKTFAWLAKRPRVNGKALERVLGHAAHLCMLRRELLSIFRASYDFIQASYNKRCKLWDSVAKEAKWASHLMKLCSVNLRRQWSSDITASDASLSGISVSRRALEPARQSLHGERNELWRYKVNTKVHPRPAALESALAPLDPFRDPQTVKPLEVKTRDPFMLDPDFPEVDPEIMEQEAWHEVFSSQMLLPEHITLLEGRGIVAAIRHKLRACSEFGKRHLHFGDNLGMILACCKGRSSAYGMLRFSRRICALVLAADISWACRWVPSELNVADKGSRRWEHLRLDRDAATGSQNQKKKTIDSLCYPNSVARTGRRKAEIDWLDRQWEEEEGARRSLHAFSRRRRKKSTTEKRRFKKGQMASVSRIRQNWNGWPCQNQWLETIREEWKT